MKQTIDTCRIVLGVILTFQGSTPGGVGFERNEDMAVLPLQQQDQRDLRGLRAAKSRATSPMKANSTPSWPWMWSKRRSSMSRFCGWPETSGWMVMGKTA